MFNTNENIPKFCFSKRFFVAILMFLVTIHLMGILGNLNIAIVAMTSSTTITINNKTIIQEPEFNWNMKTKSLILSVFCYGYLALPITSYITTKFGASTIIGAALAATSAITILSPFIIRLNLHLYVAMRILEGLCESLMYASFPELWAQWGANQDRSTLMSIGYWGCHVGGFLVYPICGHFIHKYGWPAAFYITGGSTLMCSLLWMYFVPNSPTSDKWISKKEVVYITENRDNNQKPKNIALIWKHIVLSKSVWTLAFCKLTFAFGTTFIRTCLPMYLKDITDDEIDKIGVLAGLPSTLGMLVSPLCGYILDFVQNNTKLTLTQIHKLFMCAGYMIGGSLMISIVFFRIEFPVTILLFTITSLADTFCIIITQVDCVSLAPQCAGLVAAFTEFWFAVGYICGPVVVGFLVTDHKPEQWNQYILLIGIVSLICVIIYAVFGSAEPQPWSYTKRDNDSCNKPSE